MCKDIFTLNRRNDKCSWITASRFTAILSCHQFNAAENFADLTLKIVLKRKHIFKTLDFQKTLPFIYYLHNNGIFLNVLQVSVKKMAGN